MLNCELFTTDTVGRQAWRAPTIPQAEGIPEGTFVEGETVLEPRLVSPYIGFGPRKVPALASFPGSSLLPRSRMTYRAGQRSYVNAEGGRSLGTRLGKRATMRCCLRAKRASLRAEHAPCLSVCLSVCLSISRMLSVMGKRERKRNSYSWLNRFSVHNDETRRRECGIERLGKRQATTPHRPVTSQGTPRHSSGPVTSQGTPRHSSGPVTSQGTPQHSSSPVNNSVPASPNVPVCLQQNSRNAGLPSTTPIPSNLLTLTTPIGSRKGTPSS